MDQEERSAKRYLCRNYLQCVKYEPDGNIPPDFRVGKKIGVEVRRLSQSYFDSVNPKSLEETSIPTWHLIESEAKNFDHLFAGNTYWITFELQRPITFSSKKTRKSIRNELNSFLLSGGQVPLEVFITHSLKLFISNSSPVQGKVFRVGAMSDFDSHP